jgi:uncharacterized protein
MNPEKRNRTLVRLFRFLAICALLFVMFRWFEHFQVYPASRALDANGSELGRPFEDVQFQAGDGVTLNGWFFPADKTSPRTNLVFLVCHGNGGNISHRLGLCSALLNTGANVFVFDYRGYGRSGGRPTEEGTYLDAQAAYAWLRQKGFQGPNILLFGESLCGGVASELALREPVGGLILRSSFTSIPDIGSEIFPWLPVRWLGSIKYDTRAKLPRIHVPVLVMHSRSDGTVPFHHGERNFAAANEPKLFCELHGGHNDAVEREPEFRAALEQFVKMVESANTAL